MSRLNPRLFVSVLHDFGIRSPDIHPSMTLCLGSCEVSVGEIVSTYTIFASHDIRTASMFVSKIENNEGNVLATFQPRMSEVISAESANKMSVFLQEAVDGGTAGRLRFRYNVDEEIGAKTGTTNRNPNTWFMGFTPQLVSGCWVGGEDRDIYFDSMRMRQGATMALSIQANLMKRVYKNVSLGYKPDASFGLPEGYNPCTRDDKDVDEFGIDEVYE